MAHDILNPAPKRYEYQGIVISAVRNAESDQKYLVLLMRSAEENVSLKRKMYGVLDMAFVPPPMENDFLRVEIAKNLERRYSKPLAFGDLIQWNEPECNHEKKTVSAFHREKPLYPVSSSALGPMLKIGGVINPKKPTTFWTALGEISIPIGEATRAEPDCYLQAWIRLETTMRHSLDTVDFTMIFDRFEGFDAIEQGRVAEAPWHRNSLSSRFSVWQAEPTPIESDDEIDLEPPQGRVKEENKWAETIKRQLGLFVGERLVICKVLSQYDFIIPLLTPIPYSNEDASLVYPSAGEYFHFSAIWSNIHRSFLITDMMPVYNLRSHQTTPSGNICVRAVLAPVKGFFTDHESQLGLIDDANQVIPFFEFQPLAYEHLRASVEIRAVRATENRSVRYRIIRLVPEDESFDRYESLLKTEIPFGPIHGMLINKDTVISERYPNIYFHLPNDLGVQLAPGTGVQFRATRSVAFQTEARIIECHADPKFSALKAYREDDVYVFQIRIKAIRNMFAAPEHQISPEHVQLAINSAVGPVDLRQHDHPNHDGEEYLAWVRESPLVGGVRRTSTILEVVSLSPNPPRLPANSSSRSSYSSRNNSRMSGSGSSHYSSSIRTGSVNSEISLSSSRFVGPRAGSSNSFRSHNYSRYSSSSASSSQK